MLKNLFVLGFSLLLLRCGSGAPELTFAGICDGYTDYKASSYVVPWEVGTVQTVNQGNCGSASHNGKVKYAYDFDMEIGKKVYASRAGTVYEVIKDRTDGNGCAAGENHIFIQHSDGSVAKYLHLTFNGAIVSEGATVTQGQQIGLSGNSGCSSGPHLHFEVNNNRDSGITIPVTFKNVGSNPRGLQSGQSYTAQ